MNIGEKLKRKAFNVGDKVLITSAFQCGQESLVNKILKIEKIEKCFDEETDIYACDDNERECCSKTMDKHCIYLEGNNPSCYYLFEKVID